MPQFAANLSLMYTEHAFVDRFAAAAADGFKAVEYLFPYAVGASELAQRLQDNDLRQVLFNAPPGNFEAGERGLACLAERRDEFRRGFIEQALPYALALHCPRVHVMAGLMPAGVEREQLLAVYQDNLAWAAAQAAQHGLDVLIEPINTRDIPGYLLNRQDQAHDICAAVAATNLKVQMDLYHCQIVEGDVAMKLKRYLSETNTRVGHIQIAGVPQRNEPDLGELHHPYLFALLDELGYAGHVGCEYRPQITGPGGTRAGLGWFQPYKDSQS